MEEQNEKLALSVEECAERLGVGRTYMYELVHSQGFPKLQLGRRIVIPVIALNKWLLEHSGIKDF